MSGAEKLRAEWRREEYRIGIEEKRRQYWITEDFTPLYLMLKDFVEKRAKRYAKKYYFMRMEPQDFENEIWIAAMELAKEEQNTGQYYFNVLKYRIGDRIKNLVKAFFAEKRQGQNFASQLNIDKHLESKSNNFKTKKKGKGRRRIALKEELEEVEETAVNRVFVQEIFNDLSLSPYDSWLAQFYYNHADWTLEEFAEVLGTYHQKVGRHIERVGNKLPSHYKEAWENV